MLKEQFLQMDAYSCHLYHYLHYYQFRTTMQTEPVRKSLIHKELGMSRAKIDECLDRLVEIDLLRIRSEKGKPLVVEFPDRFYGFDPPTTDELGLPKES